VFLERIITGKAFVIGDNVDTDQIIPAHHLVYDLDDPKELQLYGTYALSGIPERQSGLPNGSISFMEKNQSRSEFSIVIGGSNFGCGSSREHAPVALHMAGVKAVVAQSYARIFYRNAVDGGLIVPLESEENLSRIIKTKDEIAIDIQTNQFTNISTSKIYRIKSLGDVAEIIEAGGLFRYAQNHQLI
jgi:3-isopropylmalate/(R)-2-methylmalate dehydratase small subunit